jgi:hypothetical protein
MAKRQRRGNGKNTEQVMAKEVIEQLVSKGFEVDFSDQFGVTHLSKRKRGSSLLVAVDEDGDCNGMSLEDYLENIKGFNRF